MVMIATRFGPGLKVLPGAWGRLAAMVAVAGLAVGVAGSVARAQGEPAEVPPKVVEEQAADAKPADEQIPEEKPAGEGASAAPEAFPLPDVVPAVRRLLDEAYLTEVERRALRIRHGQWTREDVSDAANPDASAAAALIVGNYDEASLRDERTSAVLRARGELARGQTALALERLTNLCADPKAATLLAIRLRAEALEGLGRVTEADASLEPLVARMGELAQAESWADADEVAEGVRGLMLRAKWRGPEKGGAADYKAMLALLQRAREQVDKLNWNVALAEAELLADKDNYPDAAAALAGALTLNPRLAAAWAMLGEMSVRGFDIERAEKIVARLDANVVAFSALPAGKAADGALGSASVDGAMVLARARLRQKDTAAAAAVLEPWVAAYSTNPGVLAMRAAVAAGMFDFADVDARLTALDSISPNSPLGYYEVGQVLSEARQYAEAARSLGEAAKRSPHWAAPVVELGLLEVQSGRNEQALAALQKGAALDPFNVRVANSLKLISDLREFAVVESEHFIVRYRPGVDEVLAKEMPPVLERIFARVTGDGPGGIRHVPAGKTVIELMPDHHWFSVRITGMPQLHTIAAATGPLVAMEAPRSGPGHLVGPYDWPRVVQHEYTHTVTLSRTKNRLPHWFTEAAAVYLEDSPRDWSTAQLLARTVERGELFDLDSINIGFVRPKRPSDRQLAYAQGHWMYQYIVERFGPEAPLKLMDAYAAGTKEEQAYGSLLGVSREQFLKDFGDWAKAQIVSWGMELPDGVLSVPQLLEKHNTLVTSQGGEAAEQPTVELVDGWLAEMPSHPDLLRSAVTLRLKAAGDVVDGALVPYLERYAAACPPDPMPHRLLAKYFLDGKGGAAGPAGAIPHLVFLDQREQHSPTYAMELARLYAAGQEWEKASAAASRAVAMSPYDASVREFAAKIALQHKDYANAERHIRALVTLEPDREIHKQRLAAVLKLKEGAAKAP